MGGEKNENILFVWGEPLTTQVLAAMEAWTGLQDKKKKKLRHWLQNRKAIRINK